MHETKIILDVAFSFWDWVGIILLAAVIVKL